MDYANIENKLLNFNEALDLKLLDQIVLAVYQGNTQQRDIAQAVLTKLKEHPQAWTRVDTILEHSESDPTKFFALQILDELIKYRWKMLPPDQRTGIRNYIVNLIIKLSSSDDLLVRYKLILNRLNISLVQILKQDWPHNWKNFIPEIVQASRNNECICENNMRILMILSEEVIEFSMGEMTQAKFKMLSETLNQEFALIYQLCEFVLDSSSKPSLLLVTLETLLRYLTWIPLKFIFGTKLIESLVMKFLPVSKFRNTTLKCLTEVAQLAYDESLKEYFEKMFIMALTQLFKILSPDTDLKTIYDRSSEEDQHFIEDLAMFLSTFFTNHRSAIEKEQNAQLILKAHQYLIQISCVSDVEVFKICLDYWNKLAQDLYNEVPLPSGPLRLDKAVPTPRRMLYAPILSKARRVLISRMAKPEEIIIVEDDNGNIIRERVPDGAATALYKTMRHTLVFLTHLDYQDTQNIMLEKLQAQVDGSEWSWYKLNTLCWAVGSIAGAQSEDRERRFLVTVIKELLGLCENSKGKDNKAVVASNIMYVVGQYPRFLQAHWRFLSTVVNKLFEFMHETHPGVQDMSCDTLLKIAKKCADSFATPHGDEPPFTNYVLTNIASIISDLTDQQIHTFYQAIGHMISHHPPQEIEPLVSKLMELPNQTWFEIMAVAKQNTAVLNDIGTIRKLANILKTNVAACSTVGPGFVSQLARIYLDVLGVAKYYSGEVSKAVTQGGPRATATSIVKEMRTVKRETLKLLTTYIGVATDTIPIVRDFLPPLLPTVLDDYGASVPDARDHEVLALMDQVVKKCQRQITGEIPRMFDSVFECTLQMITKNFEDYPEIRLEFFKFLRSVTKYCFEAYKRMRPEHFKLVINSIVWALKHTTRNISETGLMTLIELIEQVHSDETVANAFYKTYFLSLLQDMFFVLTDRLHKTGFKLHARLLAVMINVVESGQVTAPLWDSSVVADPTMNNRRFLREHIITLLRNAFPNLSEKQVHDFVVGLFDLGKDLNSFKIHLRDFLVQIKEFSAGDDNSLLFLEDQESERNKREMAVPGLVGPHDPRQEEAATMID